MKKLAIYGAGGLGKELLTVVEAINQNHPEWDFIGFFDDNASASSSLLGGINELNSYNDDISIVVAIGNPTVKRRLVNTITNDKVLFPVLIHPRAIVCNYERVSFGNGTVITAGCILTTDIDIGEHVLVNLNSTIGHNAVIGSFSSIMPGVNIAGAVKVQDAALIGSGSNILNGICIGTNARVGSGAVVTKDVVKGATVIGIPAREI